MGICRPRGDDVAAAVERHRRLLLARLGHLHPSVRNSGDRARRVLRGGSWASAPATIRSAARLSQPQAYRASDIGMRVARSPKE